MKELNIYTDGSFKMTHKNKYGGVGVYFEGVDSGANISKSFTGDDVTSQRMELMACIYAIRRAVKKIDENIRINIITDSMYVVNSMTKWAFQWEKNEWRGSNGKKVCNIDLIKNLYTLVKRFNIKFEHVRSHQAIPLEEDSGKYRRWYGNDMADRLATTAMKKVEL